MKIAMVLFAALVINLPAHAQVYKWKDASGRVHVSDQPPADVPSEQVKLPRVSESADAGANASAHAGRVVMLSTAWCGVCRRARNWMTQQGIPFTEYDVETTAQGKAEYRRLNGRGVPILLVGEQRMDGFSAERLTQMLAAP